MEDQSFAYLLGYYGAAILVTLSALAAGIWLCKAIYKMIRPEKR